VDEVIRETVPATKRTSVTILAYFGGANQSDQSGRGPHGSAGTLRLEVTVACVCRQGVRHGAAGYVKQLADLKSVNLPRFHRTAESASVSAQSSRCIIPVWRAQVRSRFQRVIISTTGMLLLRA
jgi:hypothetical protein